MVIGSGRECEVTLPQEAGVEEKHVQIRWIPGKGSLSIVQLISLHLEQGCREIYGWSEP